ncbi:MAG: zinc transporter [Planctomycetota bacterium]
MIECDGVGELLPPQVDTLWVYLDAGSSFAEEWFREHSGLEEVAFDARLADVTRPRCTSIADGLRFILLGLNLSPGADPEDMGSLRLGSARIAW